MQTHSLKTLRRNANLTLAELAQKTGASTSLLSKFERGERTISGKWVKIIANALNVEEQSIIGENVKTVEHVEGAPWFLKLQTFTVDSDEMSRIIPQGATVYADPEAEMRDGWVYVVRCGNEIHIRRVRLTDGPMRFEADSWGSAYSPIFANSGPVAVMGRVRGVVKEM